KDTKELEKLIEYKRKEETVRKGGIDSNLKIKDFSYFNLNFDEQFINEFEIMQSKYLLNSRYKVKIDEVKNTLKDLRRVFERILYNLF
ncbi:MAG: hypothetical protein IJX34_03710, partial [Clostridia bacterium]|nr:hypothetical protein [Clostridia bacterium]